MKHRLLALALGFAAALLLAEAALRLTGSAWNKAEARPGAPGYRILCLGDSFTYNFSLSTDQSYPGQLEHLLNRNREGLAFTVINAGVPGQNTSQILRALEGDLAEARPALVLLLAGGANSWNYYGYRSFLYTGWWARLADRLYTIRVVKLISLLLPGGAGGNPAAAEPGRGRGKMAAGQCLPKAADAAISEHYRQADAAAGNGDRPGAIDRLKEAALLDPENAFICWDLARLYEAAGNSAEAAAWRAKGLQAPADCPLHALYPNLQGEPQPARDFSRWLSHDLEKIIDICREKGIPVILQNYPVRNKTLWAYLPENYAEIARKKSVPLVDNYSVFEKLTAGGRNLFNADTFGHCTAEGYGIMAANAADAIIKTRIFPLAELPVPARAGPRPEKAAGHD
ncbi:MAG TPA: hypothetical protein DCZ92_14340 [Elusimicrobia bacterium]|nr:MAG: hypothetical protein A2016_08930 [Elusimicrobia bacterium GWF2_62_30]HBA61962.1 hypothetical protein [Elusimicrobiota bacterium]